MFPNSKRMDCCFSQAEEKYSPWEGQLEPSGQDVSKILVLSQQWVWKPWNPKEEINGDVGAMGGACRVLEEWGKLPEDSMSLCFRQGCTVGGNCSGSPGDLPCTMLELGKGWKRKTTGILVPVFPSFLLAGRKQPWLFASQAGGSEVLHLPVPESPGRTQIQSSWSWNLLFAAQASGETSVLDEHKVVLGWKEEGELEDGREKREINWKSKKSHQQPTTTAILAYPWIQEGFSHKKLHQSQHNSCHEMMSLQTGTSIPQNMRATSSISPH